MSALGQILRCLKAAIDARENPEAKQDAPTINVVSELQIPAAETERRKAHDQSQRRRDITRLVVEILGLAFSAVTMGAVIYYAVVANRQHGAMTQQVAEMRETNRLTREAQKRTVEVVAAENRAWVGTKFDSLDIAAGRSPVVKVALRNSGKSPALEVITRADADMGRRNRVLNLDGPPWETRSRQS
jgi:hypothetical protein